MVSTCQLHKEPFAPPSCPHLHVTVIHIKTFQKVCKNNSNELNTRIQKMAADDNIRKEGTLGEDFFVKEELSL